MSKEEMKYEINKVLDQLSDKSLEEILNVLRNVDVEKSASIFDPSKIRNILTQDKELLRKLAQ